MAYGSSRVGAYEPIKRKSKKSKNKNNGGILGGAGYLVNSALAGIGGVGEGIVDLFSAAGAALTGDFEYAKYVFKDNVVGDWHEDITEEYNPDAVWKFGGDVAHGLGQSSWFLLNLIPGANWVGTAAFGAGMVGQGISGAAEQTGDVGLKEVAYGVTTAAIETTLGHFLSGTSTLAKNIGGSIAKSTGKSALKSIASSATRKGLVKSILSDAAGEFAEEFISEYTDTFLQRAYQIDPDAEYSLKNALYSGFVGAVSGSISAGTGDVVNAVSNQQRGARIIKKGNSQTLVNTANLVADKLAGSGTNFKNAPQWVKTLRGEVDAYNKLAAKGQQNSLSGQTILGEMQASLFFAEMQAQNAGIQEGIQNSSDENRAALAEYVNRAVDKSKRKKDFTAEDIAKNTDDVAKQLAIMKQVGYGFDIDGAIYGATTDMAQESAVESVIAEERTNTAQGATMQTSESGVQGEVKYSLSETTDGRSVAVVDDDILSGIYTGTWDKTTADKAKKAAKTALLRFKDGITVKGITAKVNKTSRDEYARSDYSEALRNHDPEAYADKMRAASVADDVVVAATGWSRDGGLTHPRKDDFVDFDRGQTLISSGNNKYSATVILGITSKGEYVFYDVEDIVPANFDIKKDEVLPAVTPDEPFDAILKDSNGDIISQPEPIVNTESEKNIDKADLVDKGEKTAQESGEVSKGAETREAKETSAEGKESGKAAKKVQSSEGRVQSEEKSSESENKSSETKKDEPKVSDAKEALTDEQRKEKARKRAEAWLEWEKKTSPTVKELNTAREYVKEFDNLSNPRRLAIIRMIRSAEGKVDKKILKGIANLMAVNPLSDLEIRFADGLGGDKGGIAAKIGNKTVIVIDSSTDFKNTIQGTIAHELVHYLENKAGYKEFAAFVRKHAKPERVAEIEKKYNDLYEGIYTAEERKKAGLAKDAALTEEIKKKVAERMATEDHKKLIDSEVTAKLAGQALNNERFLKRYADRDKKFIQKAFEWMKERVTRLKKNGKDTEEVSEVANEMALMMDVLLQAPTVGESANGTKYADADNKVKAFSEIAVSTALYDALDHKDSGYDNLILMSKMPRFIEDKFGISGDLYVYRDHLYENTVSKERATAEGRPTAIGKKDRHFHNLGEERMIEAIMAIDSPIISVEVHSKNNNPTVIMALPVLDDNGSPLRAVLSFYSDQNINGSFDRKPHIVLTITPSQMSESSGARKGWAEFISEAVEDGRVLSYDKEKGSVLSVIAQQARLGNITEASLNDSITRFKRFVNDFKQKNKINYDLVDEKLSKKYDLADDDADGNAEKKVEKKAKTKAEVVAENKELRAENRELKASQQATQNKMRGMLEKMARESAKAAKDARAEVFAKEDVALAVNSIEGWTREEMLGLAKGHELKGMTRAKREEMISQIYIALHEQSAKGQSGPGSVAVKTFAAEIASEYIDSAQVVGEDGKSYHFSDIYDEATVNGFKHELTDLLYGEFSNMGKATDNAEFFQKIRVTNESFRRERLNEAMLGKDAKNVAYQAQKIREMAEKQKRDGVTESLGALTKVLGSIVDAKGNIRVGVIDKAMGEISVFLEGEKLKTQSEREGLSPEAKVTEVADVVDEELQFMVDEFRRMREGHEKKALTAEEMKLAGNILRGMKTSIERYNKEFINGHWVDVEAAAAGEVEDLISVANITKGKEYKTKIGEIFGKKVGKGVNEIYFYKILSPENVLGALESYRNGGLLQSMYHSIRVARQKAGHLAVQMKKPFEEFLDDKENAWEGNEEQGGKNGKKYSYRDKLNLRKVNVNGAELTLGEAIYLLMLTKREEAHAGLRENGYIVYDENNQKRLKVKLEDIGAARDLIYNQLDKTDLKFLEMAEEFFNKTSSRVKHDADMNIFGYSNIIDGYYVPMIRDRYSRMSGVTDARQGVMSIVTVYNKSFNQNIVANAKALEGKNIMSIINDHADGLAEYSEMYLPLKAFDRVYNRAVAASDGEVRSIREVLNNEVWNGTEQYLKDLFKDVQGQRERRDNVVDTVVGKLRSGWVNSVLGANVKVVVTQTTSLGAATQIIEPRFITQASATIAKKDISELRERAYKYSDIIEARSFDMGALKAQGNIEKVSKIGEKSGFLIGWMDERVCLSIFHAAELKVQEQTGHAIGTEENAKRAAKIADETLYTTQAMSDATERSALQRSTSEIAKLFSMFTSDTVKNLSHTWGNLMKYQAHKARADAGDAKYAEMLKQDKAELGRSVRTLAITGLMMGLITQAFKYLYAKEEEEPEDKAKDLAIDVVSSTLNIFPIVSDIVDKLFFDYDISMNVLDVVNDTIETLGKGGRLAGKALSGEFVSTNDVTGATLGIIMSGAQLFGIPVKPVERTVTGLMRRFVPSAIYGYDAMFSNPSYTADIKKAVESGDEALAEHILSTLYKNELAGVYTSDELEEIVRLYSLTDEEGKHYNVLPQKIGTEINGVKLTAAQRKKFNAIYSQASGKVNEFIDSPYYRTLSDEQKAKGIKNIYSLYYDRAAAEVTGKEWSSAVAYSYLTDNYSALFAVQAYKSGLSVQVDNRGKKITVKTQMLEYMDSLKLSESDHLVVAYANGVRGKETKAAFLQYLNALSLSEDVKRQIAERLGFEYKDGRVVEKAE